MPQYPKIRAYNRVAKLLNPWQNISARCVTFTQGKEQCLFFLCFCYCAVETVIFIFILVFATTKLLPKVMQKAVQRIKKNKITRATQTTKTHSF